MTPINWREDVITEQSMLDVFRASTKLSKSKFNRRVYIFSVFVFVLAGAWWIYHKDFLKSYQALENVTDIAFQLTIQILGFLIGGFAIFATVTDHRLMIKLAQAPMESEKGVSVFKYVFFNFLSVFAIYLVTLSGAAAVRVLISFQVDVLPARFDQALVYSLANSLAFIILAFAVTLCIVRLKSFIWNIYQAFLIFLRVSELLDKQTPVQTEGE